jgi:hypothetical protein
VYIIHNQSLTTSIPDDAAVTTSSVRSVASVGLIVETMSNGELSTFEVSVPQPTQADSSATGSLDASVTATPTAASSTSTETFSKTGQPLPISTRLPKCSIDKKSSNPFCSPTNATTLYYGKTYYATWDPDFFNEANSTIEVQIQFANNTKEQVWKSDQTPNAVRHVGIEMKKEWLQGKPAQDLITHHCLC